MPLGLNEYLLNLRIWPKADTTNGTWVKQVETTKSFGATIDDKLSLFQAFRQRARCSDGGERTKSFAKNSVGIATSTN